MNAAMAPAMTCPKCAGEMRTYERSTVHVDQCRDCRGIFLDRGELERLMDLEAAAMERTAPAWVRPEGPGSARSEDEGRYDARRPDDRRDPRTDRSAPATRHERDRGEGAGDLAELGEMGGLGALGGLAALGELGELFERGSSRRTTSIQSGTTGQPQRKRGGLFRDLFEGFGD